MKNISVEVALTAVEYAQGKVAAKARGIDLQDWMAAALADYCQFMLPIIEKERPQFGDRSLRRPAVMSGRGSRTVDPRSIKVEVILDRDERSLADFVLGHAYACAPGFGIDDLIAFAVGLYSKRHLDDAYYYGSKGNEKPNRSLPAGVIVGPWLPR